MIRMTSIAVATLCTVMACKHEGTRGPVAGRAGGAEATATSAGAARTEAGAGMKAAGSAGAAAQDGDRAATALASWSLPRLVAQGGLGDGLFALPAVSHRGLTLVPIATTEPSTEDYLVLDDAMAEGLVEIAEAGPVNTLTLTNRSERPLFLLAGEVVIGGKQDRIIGKNTIVAGKHTEALPVFCVEHGRWSGRQATFASAGALAHSTLREKASFDGQGDVWNEVADKNVKRRTANGTDTYRQTAAQQTGAELGAWDETFDAQLGAIPAELRPLVVGYAVAVGGEVVALDVFDSPRLFGRLDRKLRRSYYAEAIDVAAPAGAPVPDATSVRAFMARADAAPDQPVYDNDEAETINQLGDGAASTRVMAKRAGGGKGKPVFKSVQKRAKVEADRAADGLRDPDNANEQVQRRIAPQRIAPMRPPMRRMPAPRP